MVARFRCPACQHRLKADNSLRGRQVRCTRCRTIVAVPLGAPIGTSQPAGVVPVILGAGDETITAWPWHARRDQERPESDVDMTPMIDVVFQLLIFFMVTAAFSLQKAIELPAPDAAQRNAPAPTLEEIEQDPTFVVVRIEDDDTVWVDDSLAPTRQELLFKLRSAREGRSREIGARRMLVLASGEARHERVVVALDAGTTVGMDDVRLATLDDER